jgi:transglutaminase-like putative cysteine protease
MKHIPERLRDFPSAILLTLALFSASQRLYATSWTSGLETALLLTFFGVLLGLTLGFSSFKRWGVICLAVGYSIFLVPLVSGWILYQKTAWLERMVSLVGKLGNSLFLFFNTKPVSDPVLFVVFTGLGYWIISLLAGYALTRRGDFTMAVTPAGVVLIIIQLYDQRVGDRIIILAIYVFLCLLLLGRVYYVRKRSLWKAQRVSISAESRTDLNLAILVSALVLVFLSWIIPAGEQPVIAIRHVWENITRPLQQTRQDLGNAVVGLQGNDQGVTTEFYGDTLALGTRASVDSNVYLNIRTPLTQIDERYYWYVRTYDQYLNNQWQTDNSLDEPFTPGQHSLQLADANGNSDEFIFTTTRVNLAMLVTPPHPVWVSRPSIVNFTPSFNNSVDPLWFSADPPIKIGEQYSVHANVYNPTVLQLQKAGAIYPGWVRNRYLQLPADLSPQVSQLARQITTDAETPYDKATAITDYLRKAITYSTTIEPAPDGTDPLVWFLIDSRTGFCNYYATAEVIMLRVVGVPARMAVGFAQGEFQSPDKYIVREKDAHAWPEVYFPGIGWVEFEPTANQPLLNRPVGDTNQAGQPVAPLENNGQANSGNIPPHIEGSGTGSDSGRQANPYLPIMLLFGLSVIMLIALVVAYTTGLLDRIIHRTRLSSRHPVPVLLTGVYDYFSIPPPDWLVRWAYFTGLTPIEHSFDIVYQSLRWLGHSPTPAQTPAEAAAVLMAQLPEVAEEIRSLTLEYEHALFSQKHTDFMLAQNAGGMIRRQALRTAFRQRIAAIQASFLHLFPPRPKN